MDGMTLDVASGEDLFRLLADSTHAAIWVYQGEYNIYVNHAATVLTGYSADELLNMRFWELLSPESQEIIRQHGMARQRGELVPEPAEVQVRAKDGQCRWLVVTATTIMYQGRPAVLGMGFDITERKRAEAALHESESRWSRLIELLPDAVLIHREGEILYANNAAARLLGFERNSELIGHPVLEIVHPKFRETVSQRMEHSARMPDGNSYEHEQLVRRDGAIIDVEVAALPFAEHDAINILTVLHDTTERRRSEIATRKYSELLESLSEIDRLSLTGQPLAVVAHQATVIARRLVQCDRVNVFTYNADGEGALLLATDVDGDIFMPAGTHLSPLIAKEAFERLLAGELLFENVVIDPTVTTEWRGMLSALGIKSLLMVPFVLKNAVLGSLNLASTSPHAFTPERIQFAREVANRLAIAMYNAQLLAETSAAQARTEALSRRLLTLQEEQSRQLARELHDEIGQNLTGLKWTLARLKRHLNPAHHAEIEQAEATVTELMASVSQLSLELRPAMLDDLGLLETLEWYVQRFRDQYRIQVRFSHQGLDQQFSAPVKIVAFRVIQEALTNILRHANTMQAWVRVEADRASLRVEIEDRGQGFNPQLRLGANISAGLPGMRERVHLINGALSIESQEGAGTTIVAILPLNGALTS